jgi:DNA repair exonuclease SbcCD ATPase subunit
MDASILQNIIKENTEELNSSLKEISDDTQSQLSELQSKYEQKLSVIQSQQQDLLYLKDELPDASPEYIATYTDEINKTIEKSLASVESWLVSQKEAIQVRAQSKIESTKKKIESKLKKKKSLIEDQIKQEAAAALAVTTGKAVSLGSSSTSSDSDSSSITSSLSSVKYLDNDYLYGYVALNKKTVYKTGAEVAARKGFNPIKVYTATTEELSQCGIIRTARND